MELLLKRDRLGNTVAGSDERLLERAICGDDITAFEESSVFSCHIVFANCAVSANRVSGLSLPHLAFGDLTDPGRLEREPIDIIQYIYDSKCKNLLCRDVLDQNRTVTELFANNPHYAGFTWYSTRRYSDSQCQDPDHLKAFGDQFKVRLVFSSGFSLIIKPDIVYFPQDKRGFLVKSAGMVVPTEFANNPAQYLQTGKPLIANKTFSLAYLAIDSNGLLTIAHQQCFSADESVEENLVRSFSVSEPTPRFKGYLDRQSGPKTMVTRLECDLAVLVPE
jgi:hypothetical protein